MSRAANIYSDKRRSWLVYLIPATLTLMLCLTINFRAFSELTREIKNNESLNTQVKMLTSENIALQEEIHNLKNDTKTVEKEVKKMGLSK